MLIVQPNSSLTLSKCFSVISILWYFFAMVISCSVKRLSSLILTAKALMAFWTSVLFRASDLLGVEVLDLVVGHLDQLLLGGLDIGLFTADGDLFRLVGFVRELDSDVVLLPQGSDVGAVSANQKFISIPRDDHFSLGNLGQGVLNLPDLSLGFFHITFGTDNGDDLVAAVVGGNVDVDVALVFDFVDVGTFLSDNVPVEFLGHQDFAFKVLGDDLLVKPFD